MAELRDGESIEVQGSAREPYILKNTGAVYSCSCPAWRNQSLHPGRRTCKHLRKLRGDAAEQARLGAPLPELIGDLNADRECPPVLLAHSWDGAKDPTGWWVSEKLDGVRAYWDGERFLSRLGNRYLAPDWFTKNLPKTPLDGELWMARKAFQRTVSVVRRLDAGEAWRALSFVIFDAPAAEGPFETRLANLQAQFKKTPHPHARVLEHSLCKGLSHLDAELARVESLGGEGLMLRAAGSKYIAGRSTTLLKVKTFHDAEAKILGYTPGSGRHKGRMGALQVVMPNGTRFSVGTGFSDAEREAPPAIGCVITYRYQELSDGGVPRFPSYLRVREDFEWPEADEVDAATPPPVTSPKEGRRRFELIAGKSAKFWEIEVVEKTVHTRYGRIDAEGRSLLKEMKDAGAAKKRADKQIRDKQSKGYTEVSG